MNATSLGSATAVAYGLNSAKTGIYSGGQDASVGISVNGTLRADYAITTPSTWTLSGGLALGGCSIGSTVLCVTGTVQLNSGLLVGAGSAITSSGPGGALASGAFAAAFNPGVPGAIGGTTPSTGAFTTVNASTSLTINGGGAITSSGAGGNLGTAAFAATGTSGATVPLLNGANTFSGNTVVSGAQFGLSGNLSIPDWTGTTSTGVGARYNNVAGTINNTTGTGTTAFGATDLFGGNTLTATGAMTVTSYYAMYVRAPVCSTNFTCSNRYALGVDSLYVVGSMTTIGNANFGNIFLSGGDVLQWTGSAAISSASAATIEFLNSSFSNKTYLTIPASASFNMGQADAAVPHNLRALAWGMLSPVRPTSLVQTGRSTARLERALVLAAQSFFRPWHRRN